MKKIKADIGSIIIGVLIVFIIAILAYVGVIAWTGISDELHQTPEFTQNQNAEEAITLIDGYAGPLLDFFVVATFIGFLLFLMISSAYIDANPVVVGGFVLVLLIAVFMAAQFAETFFSLRTNSELQPYSDKMPMTNFIMGKAYPSLIAVTGFLTLIILYSKGKGAVA